jgi:hypothetical protein
MTQLSLGHALPPPKCNADALFGPMRYSVAQQLADTSQPMTRVVKDVLRVGNWNIGGPLSAQMWNVTDDDLVMLAVSFGNQQAAGHAVNLGMSHGDSSGEDPGIIPTGELVTPVDAVAVKDGVLWMACYVSPAQARFLQNPACKVSPGMLRNYFDGTGQRHPLALVHVAVTDRPVVAGQGMFLAMANVPTVRQPSKPARGFHFTPAGKRRPAMARTSSGPFVTPTAADQTATLEALDKILATIGLEPLPPGTSLVNLAKALQDVQLRLEKLARDQGADDSAQLAGSLAGQYGTSPDAAAMANRGQAAPKDRAAFVRDFAARKGISVEAANKLVP